MKAKMYVLIDSDGLAPLTVYSFGDFSVKVIGLKTEKDVRNLIRINPAVERIAEIEFEVPEL